MRYGDGTVILSEEGDIRDRFFDVHNLDDTFCKSVTKYVLKEKDGDQSALAGIFEVDE